MVLINALALFLIGCVGLHVPKAFTLLYLLSALIFVSSRWSARHFDSSLAQSLRRWRLTVLLLILFSVSYSGGMLFWGFWVWPADQLDLINALVLPALLFVVGLRAAALGRAWGTRILLAYTFGALAYTLIALVLAREHWWSWWQVFPAVIQLPWGASAVMNVRSVEQNAYPALLLLPPAALIVCRCAPGARRRLGFLFAGVSLLGAHVVWSLNGRLGWLALLCAGIPVVGLIAINYGKTTLELPKKLIAFVLLMLVGFMTFFNLRGFQANPAKTIWGQGVCDERLALFGGILSRLYEAPWGGRLLHVPYLDCYGVPLILAAENAQLSASQLAMGRLSMAHNIFFDVYFNVGFLPSLLLLAGVLPPVGFLLRTFVVSWRRWDWQDSLRWAWFCLLASQWLFQPLLYSDGILSYLSFFLLGLFCLESLAGLNGRADAGSAL